jgi:putative sterol carrier protein
MNEETGGRYQQSKNYTAEELLTTVITSAAQRDQVKLRPYLNGKIVFEITDSGKNYVFDWSEEKLRTAAIAKPDSEANVDCFITLNENTLFKICSGDLNPQIAMLSNKINIKGKVAYAVYLFNLLIQ